MTLAVHAGEILGIAGIDGNGQKQLAEALVGQRPVSSGRITLEDATSPAPRSGAGAPSGCAT